MLFLNVPYEDKDLAKSLGAKWNDSKKSWYVENFYDYYKFGYWIIPKGGVNVGISLENLFLVEGIRKCFKCGKQTKVVGFSYGQVLLLNHNAYLDSNNNLIKPNSPLMTESRWENAKQYEIMSAINVQKLPRKFSEINADKLKNDYGIGYDYSKMANEEYFANHCKYCNTIQGDFYLFEEEDGPFNLNSDEKIAKLIFKKIKLTSDILVYYNKNVFFNSLPKISVSDYSWIA